MTSLARVRVIPKLPWRFDFNDGKVPPVWIGADYRHKPAEIEGEKALVKVSTIPKGMRSQSWMGWPHLHDYTVKADFYATEKAERIPDVGLINQRYTLDLQVPSDYKFDLGHHDLNFVSQKQLTLSGNPNNGIA